MVNRCDIEVVDKMLRVITDCNLSFGGKVVVFKGDFRQVLPVVPRGKKIIMKASLVFSKLWPSLLHLSLSENVREKFDPNFCDYLLIIGNGTEKQHTSHANNLHMMTNRAILTPRNECVDHINKILLEHIPGEIFMYYSFDKAIDKLEQSLQEDLLSRLTSNDISPHELNLKVNCHVMLLRNINPSEGLYNGTRLTYRKF
ncbi:ATP-dependent DNA helicase PIF1-like [Olea europaea var. sylvestris]|uniref:ATP-dependent DNA helicase PIF1-like n=1 Tax=Olea europaea var. sylvestris TaxID=158386 RepID=UPI000C1D8350|nr:ATP-dependent DNA helicase PIF1-like [Olea europaea var. sylvestris]